MVAGRRMVRLAGAFALAFLSATACDDSGAPAPIVRIDVSPATHTYYAIEDSVSLSAVARDASNERVPIDSIVWASSSPPVIAVSPTGVATALTAGSATIIARTGGVTDSAAFTADPWQSVSAGHRHTCALTVSGKAFCWGLNSDGQVGTLSHDPAFDPWVPVPTPVSGDLRFRQISAGERRTCAVATGGTAYCWGSLADVPGANSSIPREVPAGHTFERIATMVHVGSAGRHVCGVTTGGAAVCWGTNAHGELGDNSTIDRDTAVVVAGGISFAAVATGTGYSCGIGTFGGGHCWGFGMGSGSTRDSVPRPMYGNLSFANVSAMFQHSCALTPAGEAYCWGAGVFGKLGNGADYHSFSPVPVSGGLVFSTIDAGLHHTCGVTSTGEGCCWGGNGAGQLGTGTTTNTDVPMPVVGSLTFVAISAGAQHSCGLTDNRAIYCWGCSGCCPCALGTGAIAGSRSPIRVRDPAGG
jgi:alpha-tubulin suppressor-like RCC1 family protein